MRLQFIGDYGIFLPGRDAVGCAALDRNRLIRWYTTRTALEKLGGPGASDTTALVTRFEQNRRLLERAADLKYQRGRLECDGSILIESADLDKINRP
jgi:hypothetical protein